MIYKTIFILLPITIAFQPLMAQEKLEVDGAIIIKNNEDLTPAEGTLRFNPIIQDFEGWNGTAWVSLTKGSMGSFYYKDQDQDSYGDVFFPVWVPAFTTPPAYYVVDQSDCNDMDSLANPGQPEVCDGVDNNCNGFIDEGGVCGPLAIDSIRPSISTTFLNTNHTVYVEGLNSERIPVSLDLIDANDSIINTPYTWELSDSNKIFFILSDDVVGGNYDIKLTASNTDTALLENGLIITDILSIIINSVDTNVVPNNTETSILITGDMGFIATPSAYIQASSGVGNAIPLETELFLDSSTMAATVPSGLAIGEYDVIVINPDASVGILPNSLTVNSP